LGRQSVGHLKIFFIFLKKSIDKIEILWYYIYVLKRRKVLFMEKTYLFEIIDSGEEAFVVAKDKSEAIRKLVDTYGFDENEIVITACVREEYAEMMGYDTY
jgi:hypothetical protein